MRGSLRFVPGKVSDRFAMSSTTPAIDDARVWVSAHLRADGASADTIWEVELALTEALSNVIRHAYAGRENGKIELELQLDSERLELEIVHYGEPFDAASYRPPDLDALGAGGYGLHLIAQLMDEVEQGDAAGQGTCLRLVKHRRRERA